MNIEALYQNHREELRYHLARIVQCQEIAADIIQETFIILSREAQNQTIKHPRGFLFRVASNLAYDYLKHRKVTENYAQSQDPTVVKSVEAPSVEKIAAQNQKLEFMRQVIDELPPRCREAFILHKIYGLSYREIAEQLEISESGVEKHIMKGLLYCRKNLKHLMAE